LLTAECDEEFEFPFLEKSLARIQEVMRWPLKWFLGFLGVMSLIFLVQITFTYIGGPVLRTVEFLSRKFLFLNSKTFQMSGKYSCDFVISLVSFFLFIYLFVCYSMWGCLFGLIRALYCI
jgi:hypothetical protein